MTSNVLRFPPASRERAVAYFADRLAFEADPDDVARDMREGTVDGYVLVETRTPEVYAAARIPGAINPPYRDLTPESTAGLDRALVYVCYCASFQCNAAVKGAVRLAELGFRVKVLSGGLATWTAEGYPVDGVADSAACAC